MPGPDDFPAMLAARRAAGGLTGHPPLVRLLFAVRWKLGALFGWDEPTEGFGARVPSLVDRLPPGPARGPDGDSGAEHPVHHRVRTRWRERHRAGEQTVHTIAHLGWVPAGNGEHELRLAALVKPNGPFGRLYMAAIKPFRYLIVYPAMTRQWERAWLEHRHAAGGA